MQEKVEIIKENGLGRKKERMRRRWWGGGIVKRPYYTENFCSSGVSIGADIIDLFLTKYQGLWALSHPYIKSQVERVEALFCFMLAVFCCSLAFKFTCRVSGFLSQNFLGMLKSPPKCEHAQNFSKRLILPSITSNSKWMLWFSMSICGIKIKAPEIAIK